jgi:hypothetical protein
MVHSVGANALSVLEEELVRLDVKRHVSEDKRKNGPIPQTGAAGEELVSVHKEHLRIHDEVVQDDDNLKALRKIVPKV